MTRLRNAITPGAIALAMALGVCVPDAAWAQSRDFSDLSARIDRLQRDIDTLQRTVYQGRPPPPAAARQGGALPPDARFQADMQVRLDQIESRMAKLNGRAEELEHQLILMRQRLDKLAQQMEGRAAAPPMPTAEQLPAQPAPGQPPTPAASAAPAPGQPGGAMAGPGAPPRPLGTIPAGSVPPGPPPPATPPAAATPAPSQPQLASLPSGTPRQQYDYATSLLAKQDYPAAEAALKSFVAAHPKDPLAGSAQFWIGETHFVRKDYQNAAFAYAEGIEKFPQGTKAPDSLLKLGMSLARLGKTAQACTALSRLKSNFPNASEVVKHRAVAEANRIKCKK